MEFVLMASCKVCGDPSVGFVQMFQPRKKAASYPVCFKHGMMAVAFEEVGQDWIRRSLAAVLGLKKGAIPRLKFSSEP
jgi:hypothetical protein